MSSYNPIYPLPKVVVNLRDYSSSKNMYITSAYKVEVLSVNFNTGTMRVRAFVKADGGEMDRSDCYPSFMGMESDNKNRIDTVPAEPFFEKYAVLNRNKLL